ncbi:MAG: phage major capsid protein [Ruminococcus flavefaciens]|nr:phage major capsid protein [Ruminococcus flavefaciens]
MLKKLIEKKSALKAEMQSLLDNATAEERAFTDEETTKFDSLENEIRAIDSTITKVEKMQNISDNSVPFSNTDSRAETEERAFISYITGKISEMRAGEQNFTMDNNSDVIPETIANRIIKEVTDICPILKGAEMYHVKGTLKIPKYTKASGHDVTVGYAEEFKELTADAGKFVTVDLSGYLMGALTLIGKSVLNNSAVDVLGFVTRHMAEQIAICLEKELLHGTVGKAEGALSTANTVTAKGKTAVTLEDLIKLQSAIKQSFQGGACWTMNPETFTAVKLLTDTNGRPLIEPDVTQAFPYRLLGKPVYLSDNMPKIASGAKSVLYGDYKGLSVNFRENIAINILRENYATQHAVGINAWFEFDSKITDEQKLAVLVHTGS